MINLTLAASMLVVSQAAATVSPESLALAERFAAAVAGKTEFRDTDFVAPLTESDKAALRPFAKCSVRDVGYVAIPDPTESDTVSPDPNRLGVRFRCKGVSARTPVAILLHLDAGRIGTIETRNAELMRRD